MLGAILIILSVRLSRYNVTHTRTWFGGQRKGGQGTEEGLQNG